MSDAFRPEDVDLLRMLLDEWKERSEALEKGILKLEVCSDDLALANDLCNIIRSIKRGASFAGLVFPLKLGHEIETVLSAVRERRLRVDAELVDLLLNGVDLLSRHASWLARKVEAQDSSDHRAQLAADFRDGEKSWAEFIEKTNAILNMRKREHASREAAESVGHEADKAEIPPSGPSGAFFPPLFRNAKEQFLFETYEQIDRIETQCLGKLEQEADNRDAASELLKAVYCIKAGAELYIATLPKDDPDVEVVRNFSGVVHRFENLLELVRDRGVPFDERLLSVCHGTVNGLKASLETIAMEKGGSVPHAEILARMDDCITRIQSLPDRNAGSGPALTLGKQDQDPIPAQSSVFVQHQQSIRVSQDKLDKLMNMISELLIAKNAFMHIAAKLNAEYDLPELSREVKGVGASISRISDELQNAIMSMRMIEVRTIFQKMPRIVRDIAQSTGKKMELLMEGESTEIDKTIVEQIGDPIVHLIRNAADHGIEKPEDRRRKGKSETGKIVLRAYHKNKHVYIEIEDDGKGMDVQVLKRKAVEKGFVTAEDAEKMTKGQLINLIFLPGFSTADQITEVSGRGVGMDIVKNHIEKINGNIRIESEADKGTKTVIQLPLTLAVSRGLAVSAAGETYIIPIDYIFETVKIRADDVRAFNGKYFVHLRGDVIGIEWLGKLFHLGERDMNREVYHTVIISDGTEKFGIVVDQLKSEQEFVMKALDGPLAGIPGISGSTLLGNGQVVLVVNPIELVQLAKYG